jgi:nuclear GTP-binding protein
VKLTVDGSLFHTLISGKKKKIINVPNDCPFKDDILREVEEIKRKKEEERQKQRALWKLEKQELKKMEKEKERNGGLEELVNRAEIKQKIHEAFEPQQSEDKAVLVKQDGSVKAYYKEFKKVILFSSIFLYTH